MGYYHSSAKADWDLKPILQGSIEFIRKIDETAGCMYTLQHDVFVTQEIPIQGVGREPYRS